MKDATVGEELHHAFVLEEAEQIQDGEKEQKFVRTDNPPKKSDGKGKGKKAPKGCGERTPSGQQICFRFNTKKCKAKKCKFAHVCGACHLDKHPMYACTHRTRQDAADTQGSRSVHDYLQELAKKFHSSCLTSRSWTFREIGGVTCQKRK